MHLQLILSLATLLLASFALATPTTYMEYDPTILGEYTDYDQARLQKNQAKRDYGCVARGGNCDHRPDDCCGSTSCRCNIWGANCRCKRGILYHLGFSPFS